MENQEKNDSTTTEKKNQKKSQKDMNGLIGCLVLGGLFAFVAFMICKRFSKTGLKYYNNRRKQHKTRQFRTMTVQMPDMTF